MFPFPQTHGQLRQSGLIVLVLVCYLQSIKCDSSSDTNSTAPIGVQSGVPSSLVNTHVNASRISELVGNVRQSPEDVVLPLNSTGSGSRRGRKLMQMRSMSETLRTKGCLPKYFCGMTIAEPTKLKATWNNLAYLIQMAMADASDEHQSSFDPELMKVFETGALPPLIDEEMVSSEFPANDDTFVDSMLENLEKDIEEKKMKSKVSDILAGLRSMLRFGRNMNLLDDEVEEEGINGTSKYFWETKQFRNEMAVAAKLRRVDKDKVESQCSETFSVCPFAIVDMQRMVERARWRKSIQDQENSLESEEEEQEQDDVADDDDDIDNDEEQPKYLVQQPHPPLSPPPPIMPQQTHNDDYNRSPEQESSLPPPIPSAATLTDVIKYLNPLKKSEKKKKQVPEPPRPPTMEEMGVKYPIMSFFKDYMFGARSSHPQIGYPVIVGQEENELESSNEEQSEDNEKRKSKSIGGNRMRPRANEFYSHDDEQQKSLDSEAKEDDEDYSYEFTGIKKVTSSSEEDDETDHKRYSKRPLNAPENEKQDRKDLLPGLVQDEASPIPTPNAATQIPAEKNDHEGNVNKSLKRHRKTHKSSKGEVHRYFNKVQKEMGSLEDSEEKFTSSSEEEKREKYEPMTETQSAEQNEKPEILSIPKITSTTLQTTAESTTEKTEPTTTMTAFQPVFQATTYTKDGDSPLKKWETTRQKTVKNGVKSQEGQNFDEESSTPQNISYIFSTARKPREDHNKASASLSRIRLNKSGRKDSSPFHLKIKNVISVDQFMESDNRFPHRESGIDRETKSRPEINFDSLFTQRDPLLRLYQRLQKDSLQRQEATERNDYYPRRQKQIEEPKTNFDFKAMPNSDEGYYNYGETKRRKVNEDSGERAPSKPIQNPEFRRTNQGKSRSHAKPKVTEPFSEFSQGNGYTSIEVDQHEQDSHRYPLHQVSRPKSRDTMPTYTPVSENYASRPKSRDTMPTYTPVSENYASRPKSRDTMPTPVSENYPMSYHSKGDASVPHRYQGMTPDEPEFESTRQVKSVKSSTKQGNKYYNTNSESQLPVVTEQQYSSNSDFSSLYNPFQQNSRTRSHLQETTNRPRARPSPTEKVSNWNPYEERSVVPAPTVGTPSKSRRRPTSSQKNVPHYSPSSQRTQERSYLFQREELPYVKGYDTPITPSIAVPTSRSRSPSANPNGPKARRTSPSVYEIYGEDFIDEKRTVSPQSQPLGSSAWTPNNANRGSYDQLTTRAKKPTSHSLYESNEDVQIKNYRSQSMRQSSQKPRSQLHAFDRDEGRETERQQQYIARLPDTKSQSHFELREDGRKSDGFRDEPLTSNTRTSLTPVKSYDNLKVRPSKMHASETRPQHQPQFEPHYETVPQKKSIASNYQEIQASSSSKSIARFPQGPPFYPYSTLYETPRYPINPSQKEKSTVLQPEMYTHSETSFKQQQPQYPSSYGKSVVGASPNQFSDHGQFGRTERTTRSQLKYDQDIQDKQRTRSQRHSHSEDTIPKSFINHSHTVKQKPLTNFDRDDRRVKNSTTVKQKSQKDSETENDEKKTTLLMQQQQTLQLFLAQQLHQLAERQLHLAKQMPLLTDKKDSKSPTPSTSKAYASETYASGGNTRTFGLSKRRSSWNDKASYKGKGRPAVSKGVGGRIRSRRL